MLATRAAALVVIGLMGAFISNAARKDSLPWVLDKSQDIRNPEVAKTFDISFDEVKKHIENYSAVFVDARSEHAYSEGHVRGAYNVPSTEIETHMAPIYQNVGPSQLVIVYCDGGNCEASHHVFDFLKSSRFTNLRIFEKGWEVLGTADVPKETGAYQPPGPPPEMNEAQPPTEPHP